MPNLNELTPRMVVHAVTREPVSFPVIRENSAVNALLALS